MSRQHIILRDLAIGYPHHRVAEGLNAVFNSGELTCLIGANGVGKSTLLKTLSGFLPPLSGSVTVAGVPLSGMTHRRRARTIGIVLTEKPEISNITVTELVAMGRQPYTGFWGMMRKEDVARVEEALALVGLDGLRHRKLQTLSDGERQKAMIAKALAQQTPVMLLDEPTAFLDFPSKVEVMKLLHRLAMEMDKAVVLSTHDLEIARRVGDVLWLMDDEKQLRPYPKEWLSRYLSDVFDASVERSGVL